MISPVTPTQLNQQSIAAIGTTNKMLAKHLTIACLCCLILGGLPPAQCARRPTPPPAPISQASQSNQSAHNSQLAAVHSSEQHRPHDLMKSHKEDAKFLQDQIHLVQDDSEAPPRELHLGAKIAISILMATITLVAVATLVDYQLDSSRKSLAGIQSNAPAPSKSRRLFCGGGSGELGGNLRDYRSLSMSSNCSSNLFCSTSSVASSSAPIMHTGSSSSSSAKNYNQQTSDHHHKTISAPAANQFESNLRLHLEHQHQHHHQQQQAETIAMPHQFAVNKPAAAYLAANGYSDCAAAAAASAKSAQSTARTSPGCQRRRRRRRGPASLARQMLLAFSLSQSARQIFGSPPEANRTPSAGAHSGAHYDSATVNYERRAGARLSDEAASVAEQRMPAAAADCQQESVDSLHGLRFLSMIWVIIIHSYNFALRWMFFSNTTTLDGIYKSAASQLIANGSFACDSFFFAGGFLLPYLAFAPSKQQRVACADDDHVPRHRNCDHQNHDHDHDHDQDQDNDDDLANGNLIDERSSSGIDSGADDEDGDGDGNKSLKSQQQQQVAPSAPCGGATASLAAPPKSAASCACFCAAPPLSDDGVPVVTIDAASGAARDAQLSANQQVRARSLAAAAALAGAAADGNASLNCLRNNQAHSEQRHSGGVMASIGGTCHLSCARATATQVMRSRLAPLPPTSCNHFHGAHDERDQNINEMRAPANHLVGQQQNKCRNERAPATNDHAAASQFTLRRVLANILHRYVRMMPLMMAIIGLCATLLRYLGDGPVWSDSTMMYDGWCRKNWWINAMFLHNFVNRENMCLSHSWYSAVDLQLFLVGQLVLFVLAKSRKWGLLLLGGLILSSQLITIWLTISHHLPAVPLVSSVNEQTMNLYYGEIYIKPYCRASPYLIGILLAYLMRTTKLGSLKLHKWQVLTGWSLALGAFVAIILAMQPAMNGLALSGLESALYSALSRPLWALATGWMIFACITQQAGLIGQLLGAKCFIPLSRLTYPAFLIHPIIMALFYGSRQASFHFSHYLMLYLILGNIVITYACAFILAALFELPLLSIERVVSKRLFKRT